MNAGRRILAGIALSLAAAATTAAPPVATVPADTARCDIKLNVTDPDPKGLNVRSSPSDAPGNIIGVIKGNNDWTRLHVIGHEGEWFLIDLAEIFGDGVNDSEPKIAFKGSGWVHQSKVGGFDLEPQDVLEQPTDNAKHLLKKGDTKTAAALKPVGCKGEYVQLKGKSVEGWAIRFCTNQRTTCV